MLNHTYPSIAIVGRPNVGKSSLINRLTRAHQAVVSDVAGTTLDTQFIPLHRPKGTLLLLDTAGWLDQPDLLMKEALDRLKNHLKQVDRIWFVVDGRTPLTPLDWQVRDLLLKLKKPIKLLINKIDHPQLMPESEIWSLGFEDHIEVSARAGYHMSQLEACMDECLDTTPAETDLHDEPYTRIALIGKPNSGKSTLFNQWVDAPVQIVSDIAGTTRDSHVYPVDCLGTPMLLVDTAGLRRNAKREGLERIFSEHSERQINLADICVVMIRLDEALTDQDSRLIRQVHASARGLIVLLTQTDRLPKSQREEKIKEIKAHFQVRYPMIDVVPYSIFEPSALHAMKRSLLRAEQAQKIELNSSHLTRILATLIEEVPPPCTAVSRIKPRFAHPINKANTLMVKGKQTEALPIAYRRYLEKGFQTMLKFRNRPLHIVFKNDHNPYEND